MKRDLNELYNMVCNDRSEYIQAVQTVVIFSGLQGQELAKVLPSYNDGSLQPQPELTIHDIRGYTPYYERDDIIADYPDFFDPIMPSSDNLIGGEVFNLNDFGGEQVDISDVTLTFANTDFEILS